MGLGEENGMKEEQIFPLPLTGGSWKRRGVEADSLEPLSGDMTMSTRLLRTAKVIVDYSLAWFPKRSIEGV